MNFSLILAIEFPDKKIMEVLRSENLKYDKNLLIFFLVDTLFFCLGQMGKTEVLKQPFKCVP